MRLVQSERFAQFRRTVIRNQFSAAHRDTGHRPNDNLMRYHERDTCFQVRELRSIFEAFRPDPHNLEKRV